MKNFWMLTIVVVMLILTGCVSGSADTLIPSDITLQELEKKMNEATDPKGLFASSKSYIMRQEICEKHFLEDDEISMVEVKFEKPGKFAITTYEDNQPVTVICTNGKRAWMVECKDRREIPLSKEGIRRVEMLSSLGRPGSGGYSAVFPKVELHKCTNEDGVFYRVTCYGEFQKEPMYFYIGVRDFLLRMVKMKVRVNADTAYDYENRIFDYEMRDGVLIPMKTKIRQNGAVQESKVIYYKLNPKIPARDFLPPVL